MGYEIALELIERQFWQSMDELQVKPRYRFSVEMDDVIHRFSVEGDSSGEKSGAYFCHADGCPNWGIQDYHIHDEMQKFKFDFSALPYAERERYMERHGRRDWLPVEEWKARKQAEAQEERERKEREAERERQKEKLAQRQLKTLWEVYSGGWAMDVCCHPYIRERFSLKIGCPRSLWGFWGDDYDEDTRDFSAWHHNNPKLSFGLNTRWPLLILHSNNDHNDEWYKDNAGIYVGELMIPIRNTLTRKFQGIQRISCQRGNDGNYMKGFCRGSQTKGASFEILPSGSEQSPVIFLCEGLCTGIAVAMLTGGMSPVYCAMMCHNLEECAKLLRERYTGRQINLMADNDGATMIKRGINPGLKTANDAKKKGLVDKVIPATLKGLENENVDWYDVLASKR